MSGEGWELVGHVGVDSGRVLIVDPINLGTPLVAPAALDPMASGTWTPEVSLKSAIGVPLAHIVCTRDGDGLYPVEVLRDEHGATLAVLVSFVDFDAERGVQS